jgi:hypothetical protein
VSRNIFSSWKDYLRAGLRPFEILLGNGVKLKCLRKTDYKVPTDETKYMMTHPRKLLC